MFLFDSLCCVLFVLFICLFWLDCCSSTRSIDYYYYLFAIRIRIRITFKKKRLLLCNRQLHRIQKQQGKEIQKIQKKINTTITFVMFVFQHIVEPICNTAANTTRSNWYTQQHCFPKYINDRYIEYRRAVGSTHTARWRRKICKSFVVVVVVIVVIVGFVFVLTQYESSQTKSSNRIDQAALGSQTPSRASMLLMEAQKLAALTNAQTVRHLYHI